MANQPDPDESLFLALGPSPPGAADSLELHLSPSLEADLLDLLDTHDLQRSQVIHASGGPGLAIYLVYSVGGFATALGGFKGLAAVLTALFHRHDGKRLTVKTAGLELSVQGVSDKDAERWIQLAVDQIKAQAEARKQLGDGKSAAQPGRVIHPRVSGTLPGAPSNDCHGSQGLSAELGHAWIVYQGLADRCRRTGRCPPVIVHWPLRPEAN